MNLTIEEQHDQQLSLKDRFDAIIDIANELICALSGTFSGYILEKVSPPCNRFRIF